ncbi:MAG: bifunctional glutamate N-acetyltransferase/amino-acid acetyltransferase ArgJ [Pseudomonadota bacterium]
MIDDTYVIEGFRFSAVSAGIKHADSTRPDLGLIVAESPATTVGLTTTNLVYAAPVAVTRQRLAGGRCSAVLMNSGNANAFTGDRGMKDALELTEAAAKCLGLAPELVIPMSTGVIGNPLPTGRMMQRIPDLVNGLAPGRLADVAHAIMTTDTKPKTVSRDVELSSGPLRMAGLAKGSGMIAPNMATMLAVIMTDVAADAGFLRDALAQAAGSSFNAVTIDGDMSTNDTVIVMAGGSRNPRMLTDKADQEAFSALLHEVCLDLARQLAGDGEGVTKVVEIRVAGAADKHSAARVARTVAESLLVKTAFNGEDPNWGRIVCAAGRAGVPFDPDRLDLFIGDVPIVRDGILVEGDWESAAHSVMKLREFSVTLDMKAGDAQARILTTDLSRDYVSINADYRS